VLIHQEFNLAEDLTIAQNIFLGHEKTRGWLLDDDAMRAATERGAAPGRPDARSPTPACAS
jgi:ribose transport system ATP-binding protein